MNAMERLIALSLLCAPPGTPEPEMTVDVWHDRREALIAVAQELEILDARETSHMFWTMANYHTDLNLLRDRYQNVKDAPHLWEACRFPSPDSCNEALSFIREFQQQLNRRLSVEHDRAEDIRAVLSASEKIRKIYDSARNTQTEFYYTVTRRMALEELKESLGEEAFNNGHLPCVVPTHMLPIVNRRR